MQRLSMICATVLLSACSVGSGMRGNNFFAVLNKSPCLGVNGVKVNCAPAHQLTVQPATQQERAQESPPAAVPLVVTIDTK